MTPEAALRKQLLRLLKANGWARHRSHGRAMGNVRVKHRAVFDATPRGIETRVAVVCVALNSVLLGSGAEFPWPADGSPAALTALVDQLDAFAERTRQPVPIGLGDTTTRPPNGTWPRLPAKTNPAYLQHVLAEGARFHVLSYGMDGSGRVVTRCSEPHCIYNAPAPRPT